MDPREPHAQLGGVATTAQLLELCTSRELREAVDAGSIVRLGKGRYSLKQAAEAQKEGLRLHGTISHLSAALVHGWEVVGQPDKPWISVPRNRNVSADDRKRVHLVYADVTGAVTDPLTTVVDCGRRLPFREALAVADSALRRGVVDQDELIASAARVRGKGAAQCRRVAAAATPLAANPLESALRAIALDVPGLEVRPQVEIQLPDFAVHPDLVDQDLRIAIEAEGSFFHGTIKESFLRDVRRYTLLVVARWVVIRFTYDDVMKKPEFVYDALLAVVRERSRHRHCKAG
jgi:very-short-patch-repair endonuclease